MTDTMTDQLHQRTDIYLQALKQAGHRVTAQRQAICTYLASTERHPTPYDVYADIAAVHPDISRATVYNTLKVLQALGVIVEIAFGADHTHYDTDPTPHVNLICLRCHKIDDYHQPLSLTALQEEVEASTRFQPIAARIDMLGFCDECRRKRRAEIVAQWHEQKSQTNSISVEHEEETQ